MDKGHGTERQPPGRVMKTASGWACQACTLVHTNEGSEVCGACERPRGYQMTGGSASHARDGQEATNSLPRAESLTGAITIARRSGDQRSRRPPDSRAMLRRLCEIPGGPLQWLKSAEQISCACFVLYEREAGRSQKESMDALLVPFFRAYAREQIRRLNGRPAVTRIATAAYLLRLTNWMACVKQEDGGDFDYAVAGQYTSKEHWQQISQDDWQPRRGHDLTTIYRRNAERPHQRTETAFWSSSRPLAGRTDGEATLTRHRGGAPPELLWRKHGGENVHENTSTRTSVRDAVAAEWLTANERSRKWAEQLETGLLRLGIRRAAARTEASAPRPNDRTEEIEVTLLGAEGNNGAWNAPIFTDDRSTSPPPDGTETEAGGIEQLVMIAATQRLVPLTDTGERMTGGAFRQWLTQELLEARNERRTSGAANPSDGNQKYERRTTLALHGAICARLPGRVASQQIYTWNDEFGWEAAAPGRQPLCHHVEVPLWIEGVPLERPADWLEAGRYDEAARSCLREVETNLSLERLENWQPRAWPQREHDQACNIVIDVRAGEGGWQTWAVLGWAIDEMCSDEGINGHCDQMETWGLLGQRMLPASLLDTSNRMLQIGGLRSKWGGSQEDGGRIPREWRGSGGSLSTSLRPLFAGFHSQL